MSDLDEEAFVAAVQRNMALTETLFREGEPAHWVGIVSGTASATRFWQARLDEAKSAFKAERLRALHEDLPVNQAFGLLLLWQRIRAELQPGRGALCAFVFGEGSRATPFTEAECGQKAALQSFVRAPDAERYLPVAELALRYFSPVEAYLRRSGFDGLVVKWGDEIQIPTRDLAGQDPRLAGADIVRFVSMQVMDEANAASKDWVGTDAAGYVTRFIPRRPLAQMQALLSEGLLQASPEGIVGGINLGSIAVSRRLLDALLDGFAEELWREDVARRDRPDLDPQFFTALTYALDARSERRMSAWAAACELSPALQALETQSPTLFAKLCAVVDAFETRYGQAPRCVALDFGAQYWGDIGEHQQIAAFYRALGEDSGDGRLARALAKLDEAVDADGNRFAGKVALGPKVVVRNSVLIDVEIDEGTVTDSVLIGSRCATLHATEAFDVGSSVPQLRLASGAGAYKLRGEASVSLEAGERAATLPLPEGPLLLKVRENTDLRDRARNYSAPLGDNPLSFEEAHRRALLLTEPEA